MGVASVTEKPRETRSCRARYSSQSWPLKKSTPIVLLAKYILFGSELLSRLVALTRVQTSQLALCAVLSCMNRSHQLAPRPRFRSCWQKCIYSKYRFFKVKERVESDKICFVRKARTRWSIYKAINSSGSTFARTKQSNQGFPLKGLLRLYIYSWV